MQAGWHTESTACRKPRNSQTHVDPHPLPEQSHSGALELEQTVAPAAATHASSDHSDSHGHGHSYDLKTEPQGVCAVGHLSASL